MRGRSCHCSHTLVRTPSHCVSGPWGALVVSNPQCPEQNFAVPWVWGKAHGGVLALGLIHGAGCHADQGE